LIGNIEVGFAADFVFVDPAIINASSDASSSINDLLYNFRPELVMVGGRVVAGTKFIEQQPSISTTIPSALNCNDNIPLPSSSSSMVHLQQGPFIPGKAGLNQRWKPSCACILLGRQCDDPQLR